MAVAAVSLSNSFTSLSITESSSAISKAYPVDSVKKKCLTTTPSTADCLAFSAREISDKTYFELNSGRIVEVLNFKDGSHLCVGSFSGQLQDACREGWATYEKMIDKQWCHLVSKMIEEKVDNAKDWSCAWNCLQNLIYLKTGMKVSVIELLHFFSGELNKKTGEYFESIKKIEKRESLTELMGSKIVPHTMCVMTLFGSEGAPFFEVLLSFTEDILFNSEGSTCRDDGAIPGIKESASSLIKKIQTHRFLEEGPLTLITDSKAFLLAKDSSGSFILIDPHNLKRTPDYYAQRLIQEWVPNQKETSFSLKTQSLLGLKELIGGYCYTGGIGKKFDFSKLQQFLTEKRKEDPLSEATLLQEIHSLKIAMERFDEAYIEIDQKLLCTT